MTRCEEIRSLMMDYIYDEISEADSNAFELHLSECPECRAEVESLKRTSCILGEWVEPEPDIRVIAVKEKPSAYLKLKELISNWVSRPKKLAYGFAYTFTAVFLLIAFANTEISLNNGVFNMRMGFFDRSEQQGNTGDENPSPLVGELLRQNFQLTTSLLEQSEEKQRKEIAYLLTTLKTALDQQRYQDLLTIQYELKNIQKTTHQQISQIDRVLSRMINPAEIRYYPN